MVILYLANRCPKVVLEGGVVLKSGNQAGAIASYTCNKGSELDVNIQRQCLPSGQWSGSGPHCKRKFAK